jgi:hypothetical protein
VVGVVLDKDKLEKKGQCQRFFFGHDDDIKCLAAGGCTRPLFSST